MKLECTTDEINNYLNKMKKYISISDSNLEYISIRDKNFTFKYLYGLTKSMVREILLTLKPDEFYEKIEAEDDKHKGRILYVWNPIRSFVDARGEEREIELYIKTDIYYSKKLVVVISFHKFNDFD